jgi:hypothetical protein
MTTTADDDMGGVGTTDLPDANALGDSMTTIAEDYGQPNGPATLDRMVTGGGRGAGIGWLFRKPADPVRSERAKAIMASRTPEARRESAMKAAATKKANAARRKAEAEERYHQAYNQYIAQLEAKLGRKPDIFDLMDARTEREELDELGF